MRIKPPMRTEKKLPNISDVARAAVSYTHLDVYKRQAYARPFVMYHVPSVAIMGGTFAITTSSPLNAPAAMPTNRDNLSLIHI